MLHILIHVFVCSLRNDGKKKEEFLRRWERQLTEKQKELDSMYTLIVPNEIISNQCHLSVVCMASTQS